MVILITRTLKHNFEHAMAYFTSDAYKGLLSFIDTAFIDRSVTYHGANKGVLYIVEVVPDALFPKLQAAWQKVYDAEQLRWETLGISYTESAENVVDQK
jgi:hypothetical protein